MGANRPGDRHKQRKKRAKREFDRLVERELKKAKEARANAKNSAPARLTAPIP